MTVKSCWCGRPEPCDLADVKLIGCPVVHTPQSPCAICRSYGHFTHNHPEGYVNPMYDALDPRRN